MPNSLWVYETVSAQAVPRKGFIITVNEPARLSLSRNVLKSFVCVDEFP